MTDEQRFGHPNLDRPSIARVYDYFLLGGAHNFEVDRQFAKVVIDQAPQVREAARLNRRFLPRAVRFAAYCGITQFLDLGSGLPTVDHVHTIARSIEPSARVVYVDDDPVAVECGKRIVHTIDGVHMIQADLCDPDTVMRYATTCGLDWNKPVAVLMVAVLHFIPDGPQLDAALRYADAMAPGSLLVISHATTDSDPQRLGAAAQMYEQTPRPFVSRSRQRIEALFAGTRLMDPGVVWAPLWKPNPGDDTIMAHRSAFYVGAGRKLRESKR